MNKMCSALVASMVILASGFALAQSESRMTQEVTQLDAQPDAGTQRAPYESGDLLVSEEEQKYFAALTKCESLSGNQKDTCIEAVKEKFDASMRYAKRQ